MHIELISNQRGLKNNNKKQNNKTTKQLAENCDVQFNAINIAFNSDVNKEKPSLSKKTALLKTALLSQEWRMH